MPFVFSPSCLPCKIPVRQGREVVHLALDGASDPLLHGASCNNNLLHGSRATDTSDAAESLRKLRRGVARTDKGYSRSFVSLVMQAKRDRTSRRHSDDDMDAVRLERVDAFLPFAFLLSSVDAGMRHSFLPEVFLDAEPGVGEIQHQKY